MPFNKHVKIVKTQIDHCQYVKYDNLQFSLKFDVFNKIQDALFKQRRRFRQNEWLTD